MRNKKIPLRKCMGCNEMKPKQELIRIVRAPTKSDGEDTVLQQGQLSLDATGKKPGRGAYLCRNIACLQAARKARRLERAFSCRIPDEIYAQLEEEMREFEG